MQKKRKQHYVWEHYLRAWATDGLLWCQRGDRRFRVSTDNVAHRHDFYRLKELTDRDLQVVETLISRMGEHVRELARGWIPFFRTFPRLKREWEASGRSDSQMESLLDAAINNMEEELHASVEAKAVPVLAAMRSGNSAVLEDKESAFDFSLFIAMQYMRTPRMMRRATSSTVVPGFNVSAAWGLLRTIFATNIAFHVYASRPTTLMEFLEAPPDTEFVTGDQPVVNTRRTESTEAVPTGLELYYPLTPTRALLIGFTEAGAVTRHRQLTMDEATAFNGLILAVSDGQLYARTERALVP